jgi:hypothetical protein
MNSFRGLKEVYSKPLYITLMLFSALFFYLASVIITDFNELKLILIYSQFITLKMVAASPKK